jgi:hypothetical protein
VSTVFVCSIWAQPPSTALAAGLDEQGEAQAKEASQLYKQGHYQEAASIFAKLSVEYPDMAIFERNLGACFYYLRKPEPSLSNLRQYLSRKKDIAPDDKAVVDRWIAEMEQLRTQSVLGSAHAPPSAEPTSSQPTAARGMAPGSITAEGSPNPSQAQVPTASPVFAATSSPVSSAVDFSTQRTPNETPGQGQTFYKTWWFWTGTGVVVAVAVTAIILSTGKTNSNVPGTELGNQGAFQ